MSSLPMPDDKKLVELRSFFERQRISLADEKRAQADLDAALSAAGIPFERECRLNAADIVDFLVHGGIAVEVKLKGHQKKAVYRQLERYASHAQVHAVLLLTSLAMHLPPTIAGKPAAVASLSKGWL